jgi:hypothetical protein
LQAWHWSDPVWTGHHALHHRPVHPRQPGPRPELAARNRRQLLHVAIAGDLLNPPGPGTFRMTWDPATDALIENNHPN